ncbi:unnamed protein product [Clonostachys rosea f. rosea IK726]|uniref:Uncharacterized protein n=1 Tax=Clonostachys rosea f. rosea IK726 TaxID=1349383 RepID=A0ACA9USV1_BIOOC|nr:unnamed protein product [Clonostachys rosea f. rosea IK726]
MEMEMTFDEELALVGEEVEYELFGGVGMATLGTAESSVSYIVAEEGAAVVGEAVIEFGSTVPILAASGASLGVFATSTCGWFALGGFLGASVGIACFVVYVVAHEIAPDSWSRYPPFHPLRKSPVMAHFSVGERRAEGGRHGGQWADRSRSVV